MYSEIKYDGERVQLHKSGEKFEFYSRSLKPVLPHKVKMFHEYIPLAFPTGDSLILDCEVLLVDLKTGLSPDGIVGPGGCCKGPGARKSQKWRSL